MRDCKSLEIGWVANRYDRIWSRSRARPKKFGQNREKFTPPVRPCNTPSGTSPFPVPVRLPVPGQQSPVPGSGQRFHLPALGIKSDRQVSPIRPRTSAPLDYHPTVDLSPTHSLYSRSAGRAKSRACLAAPGFFCPQIANNGATVHITEQTFFALV